MNVRVVSLATLAVAWSLLLAWCCFNPVDSHKDAKDFCFAHSGTYSVVYSTTEPEYGECLFPSGVGCRDELVLSWECQYEPDLSSIDTEEKRLSGCNENAKGWVKDFENGEDINIEWWDESEGWASFVRQWVAYYVKDWDNYKISVECVADFVDWSLWTTYWDPELVSEGTGAIIEKVDFWKGSSDVYSQDELQSAVDAIMYTVNNDWKVTVKMQEIEYQGDEASASNLDYCKELSGDVAQCVFFKTNFFIPEQDVEMAWAFEPNKTMKDYEWYLGRTESGDWKVLTSGY